VLEKRGCLDMVSGLSDIQTEMPPAERDIPAVPRIGWTGCRDLGITDQAVC
jgi:hypothetical protein